MDTATAAKTAGVTVATVRHWCRYGAIRATKTAGRWTIDTDSLTRRTALTPKPQTPTGPDHTDEFLTEINMQVAGAYDNRSRRGLDLVIRCLEARDTDSLACIAPEEVHLSDADWQRVIRMARITRSSLDAER